MKYKICKRCVMDTSDPTTKFDKKGYCNHCTKALETKIEPDKTKFKTEGEN